MDADKKNRPRNTFCGQTRRREFLATMGGGFTSLALTGLLAKDEFFRTQTVSADAVSPFVNRLAPRFTELPGKGKVCIFLYMYGGQGM